MGHISKPVLNTLRPKVTLLWISSIDWQSEIPS
jgi:hypothetical protein